MNTRTGTCQHGSGENKNSFAAFASQAFHSGWHVECDKWVITLKCCCPRIRTPDSVSDGTARSAQHKRWHCCAKDFAKTVTPRASMSFADLTFFSERSLWHTKMCVLHLIIRILRRKLQSKFFVKICSQKKIWRREHVRLVQNLIEINQIKRLLSLFYCCNGPRYSL